MKNDSISFPTWLKTIALLAVAGMLCWVLWDAHLLLRDARTTLTLADPVLGNLNATSQGMAAALVKVNALADVESGKIAASTEELRKTERATRAGIDSLRQVFIDIHQNVVPQVTATIAHLDTNQAALMNQLTPTLENASKTSAALARDLADPAIPETLHHVDEISAHTAAGTANLEATTADLKAVADKFREVYTKPGRNTWETIKALLHLVFEARGAIGI
jgi:hypothetical protein